MALRYALTFTSLIFFILTGCGSNDTTEGVSEGSVSGNNITSNQLPTVNAGADREVEELVQVKLTGTASDSDGTITQLNWQQVSGPAVIISNENTLGAYFIAPQVDTDKKIIISFSAVDNHGASQADEVTILVKNKPNDVDIDVPSLVVKRFPSPGRLVLDIENYNSSYDYNLYYAKEGNITPSNYSNLEKAKKVTGVKFPYELPAAYNDYQNTYFMVEAISDSSHSISAEVSTKYNAIAGSNEKLCVAEANAVICWGQDLWLSENRQAAIDTPTLRNTKQISGANVHQCALDDSGVTCWGDNTYGQIDPPALINPYHISVDAFTSCALDDSGLKCWGKDAELFNRVGAVLEDPKMVELNLDNSSCASDNEGLTCWDNQGRVTKSIATQLPPSSIAVSNAYSCMLVEGVVSCFSDIGGDFNYGNSYSDDATLALYNGGLCVLDNGKVDCSHQDSGASVPELSNPYALAADGQWVCALDDIGHHCWGDTGAVDYKYPELSNVTSVADNGQYHSHHYEVCFVDDKGLQCANREGKNRVIEQAVKPSKVALSDSNLCFIENGLAVCDESFDEQDNVTDIAVGWFGQRVCTIKGGLFSCNREYGSMGDGVSHMAVSDRQACVIQDQANNPIVSCQSGSRFTTLEIEAANVIASNNFATCAANNDGAFCWTDDISKLSFMELKNPKQLVMNDLYNYACALDDSGVVCWRSGLEYIEPSPDTIDTLELSNPTKLMQNGLCGIDDYGLACWDTPPFFGYGHRNNAKY